MRLSKKVFIRFEPEMNEGTVYIFNRQTEKIYKSEKIVYDVLKNIDERELGEIVQRVNNEYPEYSQEKIKKVVFEIIEKLKIMKVIEC